MRAFVIRTFRPSKSEDGSQFDPKKVQDELITPALTATGYTGSTSDAISDSGSVPERMIQEIVNADLVIAEITVANPNVYYELGVRHALRPAGTILLRARSDGTSRVPFDVQGWSYVGYSDAVPAQALEELIRTIRTARAAGTIDSPVFRLFPDLRVETRGFDRIPDDLVEEIATFQYTKCRAELRLLADEVVGLRYELAALRHIAAAQSAIGDRAGALLTWEAVRVRVPDDFQASKELGTLYERRGETPRSDHVLRRALAGGRANAEQRSELLSQLARNRKDEWTRSLPPVIDPDSATAEAAAGLATRQQAALRSPKLDEAIRGYVGASVENPGDYYPALNALALTCVQRELAGLHPDVWRDGVFRDGDATVALGRLDAEIRWLGDVTRCAILARRRRQQLSGADPDPYLEISDAELTFLTAERADDPRITAGFQRAVTVVDAPPHESVTRQFDIYRGLGVLGDRRAPVEVLFDQIGERPGEGAVAPITRIVLFSGHTVDCPSVGIHRFPWSHMWMVKGEILDALSRIRQDAAHDGIAAAARTGRPAAEVRIVGFAGGSSGADLLFHEACRELGFATEMFLTVPEAEFRSVGIARDVQELSEWTDHFNRAIDRTTCHVLSNGGSRPTWRDAHEADPLWSRWIRWMFHHARARADVGDLRAVVVWDGKPTNTGVGVFGFMQAALHNGVGVRTIRLPPVDGDDVDGSTPPHPVRGHDDRASADSASDEQASGEQASGEQASGEQASPDRDASP